jgi:GT2 family glycosyltransferase
VKLVAGIVLYETPEEDVRRLKSEFTGLGVTRILIQDNTGTGLGYAAGVNRLLRRIPSDATHVFLANPDISLDGIDTYRLMEADAHFDIWGYAMKQAGTVYYGGEIEPRRMSGGLSTRQPEVRFASSDFVSGSLMVVRTGAIPAVGGFDETYGMYYEDVEFCFRARKLGFRVGVDTGQTYTHVEESSADQEAELRKRRWLARNRIRFLWRNGTWGQKMYELLRLPKTLREDGRYLL